MGRLQYIVATIIVLSGYHRLANVEFIIESFHSYDNAAPKAEGDFKVKHLELPPAIKNSTVISVSTNKNMDDNGYHEIEYIDEDYIVGQFCPYCTYNDFSLCLERVQYLMSRYNTPLEDAKNSVLERCKTPPLNAKSYTQEDEPVLTLHAGPHKTGTTALQAFIYDMEYANATVFKRDNLRIPHYDELPGLFGEEGVGLNLPHCSLDQYKSSGGQMTASMCERMRSAIPLFMMDAYNKSENVLIVAEDFDRKEIDYKRLRHFIRPYNRIKVVVTYRRLHDWLPSFYNQIINHYILKYLAGDEHFPR